MGDYFRPTTLSELQNILAGSPLTVLAGGTDYYPARVGKLLDESILDITAVDELKGIERSEAGWKIGAATKWSEIAEGDFPPLFDGLKAAALEVGGRQIQNSGTIGGNLCNASPAADGVPALMSLGAHVEIAGAAGSRMLPLEEFVLGNRRTALEPSEILAAVHIPTPAGSSSKSVFLKLGSRRYLVISLVMVAGTISLDGVGNIADCRIVVGACSEVARRLPALEELLVGQAPTAMLADLVSDQHFTDLSPINDVRASAEYRLEAAKTLVRRLVAELGETS